MSGCDDLKALLAPLGLYDLSAGTRNEAELFALGAALDGVDAALTAAEREALVPTAVGEGLALREALLPWRPPCSGRSTERTCQPRGTASSAKGAASRRFPPRPWTKRKTDPNSGPQRVAGVGPMEKVSWFIGAPFCPAGPGREGMVRLFLDNR